MKTPTYLNKIQILDNFKSNQQLLSENSMGIYLEQKSTNKLTVHFKPLNELFTEEIFHAPKGILINFERDLIDEDDIEYALDIMFLFNQAPKLSINQKENSLQIQTIIELLKKEYYLQTSSYIMIKTLLKVLLLHLIRYRNHTFLEQDLNQKRVYHFLELMEVHFLNEINSEFYAHQLGISSRRLNQILKEKLSLTAKQIIQQRLVTEAKRKLIKSNITTKELAFELGFNSISLFSRFFKNKVGLSPTDFKKQHALM